MALKHNDILRLKVKNWIPPAVSTKGDVHSTFQTCRSCFIYLHDENPAKIRGLNDFWNNSKWVDQI